MSKEALAEKHKSHLRLAGGWFKFDLRKDVQFVLWNPACVAGG
jgi:hypothetical protein